MLDFAWSHGNITMNCPTNSIIKYYKLSGERYCNVKRLTVHGYMATITKIRTVHCKIHDNKRQSPIACKRHNCETAKSGRG